MNLDNLRQEIDELDSQLVALFLRRMELSGQVAQYKRDRDLPVLDAARQQALLRRVETLAGLENRDYARPLYQTMLALSRSRQNQLLGPASGLALRLQALAAQGGALPAKATVACQQTPGDDVSAVCQVLFDTPRISLCHSLEDLVRLVAAGVCQYGMLPVQASAPQSKIYDLLALHGCFIVSALRHWQKPSEKSGDGLHFLCIAPLPAIFPDANRMALMLTLPHGEGHLQSLLTTLAVHRARPIQLESRTGGDDGQICYLNLALETGGLARLITDLEAECCALTYLGTY